ncbi:hypothetical protein [Mycobacterium antarcticum]|uniref:hypothetical protein n=1 Tax=unclassified Mycolicibacterium TaxID=2636767 RepID=UPI0024E16F6A|nr:MULTISPECIES: hypothetical protein [unclassified Mycolicibacterium]
MVNEIVTVGISLLQWVGLADAPPCPALTDRGYGRRPLGAQPDSASVNAVSVAGASPS